MRRFDFDHWKALAERDPQAFEKERRRVIAEAIARYPEASRQKLERLQFRLDGVRRRARTPMGGCLALHREMMIVFYERFVPAVNGEYATHCDPVKSAGVVPIEEYRNREKEEEE